MSDRGNHVVFGPLGCRITRLAASPNGEYLVLHHVPQNYDTSNYHWLLFRRSGDTYEQVGELAGSASDVAPLDDGQCVLLMTDYTGTELARWAPAASGMAEVARWGVWNTICLSDAQLRMLPVGAVGAGVRTWRRQIGHDALADRLNRASW